MVPHALIRRLRNPAFEPRSFTATKFDTAEDKAWFANHFLKFAATEFPSSLFTKRFYRRVSNTFGHIAHYNHMGYYDYFFRDTRGKLDFILQTLEWPCYGDPTYTYSDVELAIKARMKAAQILACYETRLAGEPQRAEIATLERLKAKYEPQLVQEPVRSFARQGDLFDSPA